MNTTQVAAIARHVGTVLSGALVEHGIASSSQASDIAGTISFLVMLIWSLYQKREAATLARATAISAKNAPQIPTSAVS